MIEELCTAAGYFGAGITFGIAAAMLIFGLLVGYFFGRRKALLAALKKAMSEAKMKKEVEKAQKKMNDAGNDDKEEEEEDEDLEKAAHDTLASFLHTDHLPGLDDHAQTSVNPIISYQMRRHQDEARVQTMIDAVLAEWGDEGNAVDDLSPSQRQELGLKLIRERGAKAASSVGSVAGVQRTHGATENSMKILSKAGLSITKSRTAGDMSEEQALMLALREKMKKIDKYLNADLEIDVSRVVAPKRAPGQGLRVANALQMANLTKGEPFRLIHETLRFEDRQDFARRGRLRVAPPLDHAGGAGEQRLLQSHLRRRSCQPQGGGQGGSNPGSFRKPGKGSDQVAPDADSPMK